MGGLRHRWVVDMHSPRANNELKPVLYPCALNKPKCLLCTLPVVLTGRDERGPVTTGGSSTLGVLGVCPISPSPLTV